MAGGDLVGALNEPLRGRGRRPAELEAEYVRDLTPEDVADIQTRELGIQTNGLQRISQRHHNVARLLAAGTSPGDCAIMTGLSASRISTLQADPTFQELLAFYQKSVDIAFQGFAGKLAQLGEDVLDELQKRVEEEPEEFTNKELTTLLTEVADRTGHGKTATNINLSGELSDRMHRAMERVREARKKADGSYDG